MKLGKVETIEIIPTAPFDFDSTFHKPDHFTSGDNIWQSGKRWQTWRWPAFAKASAGKPSYVKATKDKLGVPLGLVFKNVGETDKPKIRVEVWAQEKLNKDFIQSLMGEIRYRYNLDLDLTGFYQKFGEHPVLKPIIDKWRGMRPGHPSSLYEYLMIGIVLQNASVRRSIQMFSALLEKYGTKLEFGGQKLWCFWEPGGLAGVTEEELRGLKVGYRAKSIKKIDDQFASGGLDEADLRGKDRATQMAELLKLYGVGPATVWYLLFDVFHHWDFFNHISPWEQKIYSRVFFDREPDRPVPVEKLLKHFEQFGEYKQLAVHYIWEDLWWKRKHEPVPWLEKLIRV